MNNYKIIFLLLLSSILSNYSNAQTVMISGNVSTALDLPMAGVTIEINTGESTLTATTDEQGNYIFEAVPIDNAIRIVAEKEDDHLNGVSSLDIVLGARHILGLERFDSPSDYIAMDLNKSGSITGFDLVVMRQLILGLGLITEFRNYDAWRFMEKRQFDGITILENNELNYTVEENEFISINSTEPIIFNIIGIKIGDASGNATP